MANPEKGEVDFKAGGTEYRLSFSADAFAEIEDALGMPVDVILELFRSPEKITLKHLRVMFWKGLGDHHEGITFDDARAILRKLKPTEMAELVGKAMVLSMPAGDNNSENPPQPDQKNGTGPASSTAGAN